MYVQCILTDDDAFDGEGDAGVELVDETLDFGQVLLTKLLHAVSHWFTLRNTTMRTFR
jgi:hypothetical protein